MPQPNAWLEPERAQAVDYIAHLQRVEREDHREQVKADMRDSVSRARAYIAELDGLIALRDAG